MKHIWVVESSAGKKWRASGITPLVSFTKKGATQRAKFWKKSSPGLKWRAVKYMRMEGK